MGLIFISVMGTLLLLIMVILDVLDTAWSWESDIWTPLALVTRDKPVCYSVTSLALDLSSSSVKFSPKFIVFSIDFVDVFSLHTL